MRSSITEKYHNLDLSSHVSCFLQFFDEDLRLQYEKFKVAQSNTYAFIPLQIACCFFYFFGALNGLRVSFDWFNIFNVLVDLLFVFILGNYLIVVYFKDTLLSKESIFRKFVDISYTSSLESLWCIGNVFCLSLVTFSTGYNGECRNAPMTDFGFISFIVRGCNYSGITGQLPMDLVMTMYFAPIIYAVILKGASFLSIVVSMIMSTVMLMLTMYMFNLSFTGPIILLFSPICLVVLYEFQRQDISLFLLTKSQAMLLEEVDRLSAETHAKELRSMIGNVAHDLKTPLSAFISGLDFISSILLDIQMNIDEKMEVVKGLQSISESVVNMKNINSFMRMSINRCIDYTKASNGMVLVPRFETVNLRETLQLPLNCMKNLQDGKVSIELLPLSSDIAMYIITDLQWLQENILCLLSNAVKYSAEGVVTMSVQLIKAETESESMLRIEIEDNGIGISDDMKPLLFTPFKQAQRMVGGTGLGLYALAKRMEAAGGRYGVENRKNGQSGCVFWFSFPYRPDLSAEIPILKSLDSSSEQCPSPQQQRPSKIAVPGLNLAGRLVRELSKQSPNDSPRSGCDVPLNILLVDDSISILKMSGKMLTRLGHTVTTAENGAVALKLMSSTFMCESVGSIKGETTELMPKYDIVLMDLQMPIMDGLEATKRLRQLENDINFSVGDEKVHQTIVGVSANSDHLTIEAAFEAGVDDFIPKPFNVKSFEEIIKKLMNRKGTSTNSGSGLGDSGFKTS